MVEFDPNQPFESTSAEFDPNQPFEAVKEVSKDKTLWEKLNTPLAETETGKSLQAGVRGAASAASFGFADEIEGLAKMLAEGKLSKEEYTKQRDIARAKYEQAWQEHPVAYGTGYATGTAGALLVPGVNIAKGATLGKAALQGSALGAAQAAGSSEADLTKGEVGQFAGNIAMGATLGATVPAIGKGLTARGAQTASEISGKTLPGEQIIEEGLMPTTLSRAKGAKGIINKLEQQSEAATETVKLSHEAANAAIDMATKAETEQGKRAGLALHKMMKGDQIEAVDQALTALENANKVKVASSLEKEAARGQAIDDAEKILFGAGLFNPKVWLILGAKMAERTPAGAKGEYWLGKALQNKVATQFGTKAMGTTAADITK